MWHKLVSVELLILLLIDFQITKPSIRKLKNKRDSGNERGKNVSLNTRAIVVSQLINNEMHQRILTTEVNHNEMID